MQLIGLLMARIVRLLQVICLFILIVKPLSVLWAKYFFDLFWSI